MTNRNVPALTHEAGAPTPIVLMMTAPIAGPMMRAKVHVDGIERDGIGQVFGTDEL